MSKETISAFSQAENLLAEIASAVVANPEELEQFRIKYIGSKGLIRGLFAQMKTIEPGQRKEYGQLVNSVKKSAEDKFAAFKSEMSKAKAEKTPDFDPTMPPAAPVVGARHPLNIIRRRMVNIFGRIGFTVAEGPEIEDDWHNFTAMNTPQDHPARDMQDTFYIQRNPDWVLRTHTSPVQARVMEKQQPPIRIIAPGRTYRNETISARAHCIFHQVEGLYVDQGVSFADLKQTLVYFAHEMFGSQTAIRLRPSYFPFTEPSAELDITCLVCHGEGCSICKHTGWVEIGGCGMVDPAVFTNCKIDPETYTGFAFGFGIERITMLKYRINDIRLFSENDVRFLRQFTSEM